MKLMSRCQKSISYQHKTLKYLETQHSIRTSIAPTSMQENSIKRDRMYKWKAKPSISGHQLEVKDECIITEHNIY